MKSRMSSKELVTRAIEFTSPERVPYNFDSNRTPVIGEKYGDDFEWVFADPDPDFRPRIKTDDEWETEFGILYRRMGRTFGEAVGYPLTDANAVEGYQLPAFNQPKRYLRMEQSVREHPDKYILGMFPHFLFQMQIDLFGFENLMIELMDNRAKVEEMADRMMENCLQVVDCMADRGANGLIAIEDLGLQDRLIIAPDLWREIYKLRMARIVEATHKRGMHFMSHTCGQILDIIEDFIEIGVDVVQIDQQDNMGIDALASRYAGRVCFFCPVDIQTTLPGGSFAQIEAKARHLMKAFGGKDGGFMAKTYPQPEAIEIPEVNTKYMCEVFKRDGRYPLSF